MRRQRQQAGLSRAALARLSGVGLETIRRAEADGGPLARVTTEAKLLRGLAAASMAGDSRRAELLHLWDQAAPAAREWLLATARLALGLARGDEAAPVGAR